MKILIAEDDPVTLKRIQGHMARWGFETLAAHDGAEAARLFTREHPRIVVTDWLMPELDGLQLLRFIRQTGVPAYVIMLTSRGETADLVEALDAGADDFLGKPFDNEELRARLRAGLRLVEQEQRLEHSNRELAEANLAISASHQRMKAELDAAARIQSTFLPRHLPEIPQARFAWRFEPCSELSGDAFNILPFDEDHIGVFVADVSGHGVASSLLSVQLNLLLSRYNQPDSLWERGNPGAQPPSAIAEKLNRLFPLDQNLVHFFTLLYGILDFRHHLFRYTSAGHSGPIVVSGTDCVVQPATPPAVGVLPEARFTEAEVRLHPGDRLFLYTDGIFEVCNGAGEELGERRLANLLAEHREDTLDESLNRLVHQAHSWSDRECPADDLSVLGVEIAF